MKRPFILAAALMLASPYVHAQEAAQAEPSRRDVCLVSDAFAKWPTGVETKTLMKPVYDKFADALEQMCRTQPTDEQFRAGNGQVWLAQADALARALADELLSQLLQTQTRTSINRERLLALQVFRMQVALGSPRTLAFSAVREVPREVIKTVEVEARCPEPPPAPSAPRDVCADALREGACRWSSDLYKWTGNYRGSGDDWALADGSKGTLDKVCRGNGDPRSVTIGWLAQWRTVRRSDNTSFLGSGPMPRIAADMKAQLSSCGVYVQEER